MIYSTTCRRMLRPFANTIDTSRCYYYYVDGRGLLFFEAEERRNFATCLKDKKFLVAAVDY